MNQFSYWRRLLLEYGTCSRDMFNNVADVLVVHVQGVDKGQGGEQQYVLQQPEYDEQRGYQTEEGYAHVSEQQTDEQGCVPSRSCV